MFGTEGQNTLPSCWFSDSGSEVCQCLDGTTRGPIPTCEDLEGDNVCTRLFDTLWWKLDAQESKVDICLVERGAEGQVTNVYCTQWSADLSKVAQADIGQHVAKQVQQWKEHYLRTLQMPIDLKKQRFPWVNYDTEPERDF
jgi:hypothetical protein